MKKVLIIEDDQVVANIYRNKLAVEGFQVEIARDGQVGLDMVHSFHPDLVLLDLVLPSIPGIDLMRTIRAEPGLQQLPVIVFSNTYLTNMIQEAWKAGATKCLSKANCTPRQVIDVVRNSLERTARPRNLPATPVSCTRRRRRRLGIPMKHRPEPPPRLTPNFKPSYAIRSSPACPVFSLLCAPRSPTP
jgi:Response regulators consisting of a CheY-like receiver domain and a winged-helix DNA-binding domain